MNKAIVSIEGIKGNEREYVIKDKDSITIGRVFIIEMNTQNRYASFRIKIYKGEEESNTFLKEALKLLLSSFFHKKDIQKVNVLVEEDSDLRCFTELGFILEGILGRSIISNKVYKDELVLGIDTETYCLHENIRIVRLQADELCLKVLTVEDAEEALRFYKRNINHLKPFEPSRDESFYTLQVQKKNLLEDYKLYILGKCVSFGIFKESRLIGKIRISNIIEGGFKSAFLGYSMDSEEQGKGYMKKAVNLICDYAFKELELHRLEASTLTDNIKSQRVLKSCGFEELGVNKKYLFINGRWRDHITFYKISNL